MRIEDLDSPRVKAWAVEQAMEDLRWLGLDWDEGPDIGGPNGPYVQTQRLELYRDAFESLRVSERIYPCTCSRSDVLAAAKRTARRSRRTDLSRHLCDAVSHRRRIAKRSAFLLAFPYNTHKPSP